MSRFIQGSPLRVYLAAPYSQKEIMNQYAQELREAGITVTSRWLEEPHAPTIQLQELQPADHQRYAEQDVEDVSQSDIVVFFTDATKAIVRAGRHVEFGIAVGLGLTRAFPIFVVGHYENIFHYLPQVYHYETWGAVKDRLLALRGVE